MKKTEIIGAAPPPVAWLVIRRGGKKSVDHRLGEDTRIGRDARKCDLILDDDGISADHARIRYEGGPWVLYDLASTNGTFHNGRRIQRSLLADGDEIRLGFTKLIFKEVKPGD